MQEDGLVAFLLSRLERISADSYWAHRASGIRGALLRKQYDMKPDPDDPDLDRLLRLGFDVLNRAAEEKIK
jgi:hypothetical protein